MRSISPSSVALLLFPMPTICRTAWPSTSVLRSFRRPAVASFLHCGWISTGTRQPTKFPIRRPFAFRALSAVAGDEILKVPNKFKPYPFQVRFVSNYLHVCLVCNFSITNTLQWMTTRHHQTVSHRTHRHRRIINKPRLRNSTCPDTTRRQNNLSSRNNNRNNKPRLHRTKEMGNIHSQRHSGRNMPYPNLSQSCHLLRCRFDTSNHTQRR